MTTYPKWWNLGRVAQVFTTESRQKDRESFLTTHRPFRKIRVDFCKEQGALGGFVTEEQLLGIVHGGPLEANNRLVFIVGEAGSGKSELCQWLEYTADTACRMPVHISRSMTTASHVASRLRDELRHTGSHWGTLQKTPITIQARHAALSATVLLYERGSSVLAPANSWEQLLASDEMLADLVEHLESVAFGRAAVLLLPDSRVQELCIKYGIELDPTRARDTADGLRRLLTHALDQAVWLGDLRELLGQLSQQAISMGRRPLLLIEDITAFQVLSDLLLDYLLDLTSGHYDAVIGLTTGFERTQLSRASLAGDLTHVHHRLRARFVLTDDQGRAYGLEEDIVEFARAYLQAVNDTGAAGLGDTAVPDAFEHGLYPFTETALRRAFACLEEEGNPRQVPRLLIEHVLGASLVAEDIPPIVLDRSPYLRRPPVLFRHDDVGDETLVSLLRWYGEIGEREVTLDRSIADYWGLEVPSGLCRDGVICVPRAYVMPEAREPEIAATWQLHMRELQRWLDTGGLYPSRETLKRGIERVLLSLGDPRSLGSSDSLALARSELFYTRGDERLPVYLADRSGDVLGPEAYIKVEVMRTTEERGTLEELAYAHLSGSELSQICQNLASTLEWARRRWDDYHARIRTFLAECLGGITAEELVWTGWRLVASASGAPWSATPHLRTWTADATSYAASSPWGPAIHHTCYVAGEELVQSHETFRRLFIGMFTLRDSLLDVERCRRMSSNLDSTTVINRLAQVPMHSLRAAPFKVRPEGQSLYNLLVPLQHYARALTEFDIDAALRTDQAELVRLVAHLRCQEGIELETLQNHLRALRWRCGELGIVWRQDWNAPLQTLETLTSEALQALRFDAESADEDCRVLAAAGVPGIWEYLTFRHRLGPVLRHPYWEAISTVDAIRDEMLASGRRLYRRDGRALTATPLYREVLGALRTLREELRHG